MSRLSTKNIPGGGSTTKVLQPGNVLLKINSVALEKFPYKENPNDKDAYHLVFNTEGKDLGPAFEGFYKDVDDKSKGRYKGAVGKIKADRWPFKDGVTKSGIEIFRDIAIMRYVGTVCKELGFMDWFDEEDLKHETIESFIEKFNSDAPFKDKWLRTCVLGKEYVNKAGYTNFDLAFPKFTKTEVPFELDSKPVKSTRVIAFDPSIHIEKKKIETVASFDDDGKVEKVVESIPEVKVEPEKKKVLSTKSTELDFEL